MDIQERVAARRKELENQKKEEEKNREKELREAAHKRIQGEKSKPSEDSLKCETAQDSKFTEDEINEKVKTELDRISIEKATGIEKAIWGVLTLLGVILLFYHFWTGLTFILSGSAWRLWLIKKYKSIIMRGQLEPPQSDQNS